MPDASDPRTFGSVHSSALAADNERYTDDLETRSRLVAAAYVLLLRDGTDAAPEVLLHLRQGTGYRDGHWALVAGHVDPGESVPAAAVREAREEVGVDVAVDDLEPLTAMHRTLAGGGPREQRMDCFFAVRRWTGDPVVMEPTKNAGLRWWPLAEIVAGLPEPCVPHEEVVLRLLASRAPIPAITTFGF